MAPSAATPAACDPGQKVVKGTSIYVPRLYVVDVGIITIAGSKPTARYLGIRSQRLTPGLTTAGVAVQAARSAYSVAPSVVKVAKGMRSGTFSGDALGPRGAVSGSWTCDRPPS